MIAIINDLHADPKRVGGTTMESRQRLQEYTVNYIKELLMSFCSDPKIEIVVVLGDLYNKAKADNWVVDEVEECFTQFLRRYRNKKLVMVRGNHDSKSEKVNDLSSLEHTYRVLERMFPDRVKLIFNSCAVIEDEGKEFFLIPHMFDQDEFDAAVTDSISHEPDYLLIHANIDNSFATGDHSLNLTKEQIKSLNDAGIHVIAGHEHTPREPFPNVTVIGNQFPTSVSDCISNKFKRMVTVDRGGISSVTTWEPEGKYFEGVYGPGQSFPTDVDFVRFTGDVEKTEMSRAIANINDFRKKSSAFVVSNSLKVAADSGSEVRLDDISRINVLDMLVKKLPRKYQERVLKCIPSED